ncbi:MAG: hypothetical protein K5897_09980 [Eubacterium sp.]|nr:hypothetical protein [Eubacterium sp.]
MGLIFGVASSGALAVVIAIAIPILITFVAVILMLASRYSVKLRDKIDAINKRFLETLEWVRVIRAFNKQADELRRFDEVNEETTEVSRRSITISGMMTPVVTSLFGLTSVGAMLVGTYQVMQDSLDVSALVSATQYINIILIAITLLGKNLFQIITAAVTLVGVLFMLLGINIWLTMIAAALIPATFLTTIPIMKLGGEKLCPAAGTAWPGKRLRRGNL